MAKKQVLDNEWNMAKAEIQLIGEFTEKTRRFQYRTTKKKSKKEAKKWLHSLETLADHLNTHLINRDREWEKYSLHDKMEGDKIKNFKDLIQEFNTIEKKIEKGEIKNCIKELRYLSQIVNLCRVQEGFSLPDQIEEIQEETVLADKRQ